MDELQEALERFGESARITAQGIGGMLVAFADAWSAYFTSTIVPAWNLLANAASDTAALNAAPPRVRHLALHGKKRKTRKKNLNRARKLCRQANR